MSGFNKLFNQTKAMREKRKDWFFKVRRKSCDKKKVYETFKIAEDVAYVVFADKGISLRSYQCPHCNKWHLTSKRKQDDYKTDVSRND